MSDRQLRAGSLWPRAGSLNRLPMVKSYEKLSKASKSCHTHVITSVVVATFARVAGRYGFASHIRGRGEGGMVGGGGSGGRLMGGVVPLAR